MISHEHRFIYVHVPRTGGTSMESVLRPYASPSVAESGSWPERNRTWRNRFLFNSLKSHPGYYSFLFVRNPWDRLVSNWKYFYPDRDFNELIHDITRFLSLNPERFSPRSTKQLLHAWYPDSTSSSVKVCTISS